MPVVTTVIKPWAIYCTSKACEYKCIGRYFNRQDAVDGLTFLQKHAPQADFVLLYDTEP